MLYPFFSLNKVAASKKCQLLPALKQAWNLAFFACSLNIVAPEQKARSTYEYLLNLIDDPDVADPIKFLREREVVHFQRFGESLRYVQEYMDSKRMFHGK